MVLLLPPSLTFLPPSLSSSQGPTWSSIEYGGKWKPLHYALKKVFAPVLVSGYHDPATGTVNVHVTRCLPLSLPSYFAI